MNRPEVLNFLQFGIEGEHHEVVEGGALAVLPIDDIPFERRMSGGRNFDINPLMNGVWFDLVDPDRAFATAALGYPGIDSELVINSLESVVGSAIVWRSVNDVGTIQSETGMSAPLTDLRDQIMNRLVGQVSPENFETEFNREYDMYLGMGAQAIIDERDAAWVAAFGDVSEQPSVLD
jgi:hypothetical protein